MTGLRYSILGLALAAAGCSPPTSESTQAQSAAPVPADIAAVASAAAPGITITSGELNASGNQFEVTGTLPNGDEVEIDLAESGGAWIALEVQRDIEWSSVPNAVRAAAAAAPDSFEPVRVIESTQSDDGSVVYELFRPVDDGSPSGGPDLEVRWHEGEASLIL